MGSASSAMSASPALRPTPTQPFALRRSQPPTLSSLASTRPDPPLIQPLNSPNDLDSLRAAALKSGKRQQSGRLSTQPSVQLEAGHNASIATTLAVPLARVEISSEKEEGEISEDDEGGDDETRIEEANVLESRERWREKLPSQSKIHPIERDGSGSSFMGSHDPAPRVGLLRKEGSGKGEEKARESPGPVASAPSDISPSEARQYMDIIRKLLYEGFSPDALLRRGATAKYVTAVCEEIVAGTKRRKALWLEANDTEREDTVRSPVPERKRSHSPDVEVSVTITRQPSNSSESSAEIRLMDQTSPPKPRPQRLIPSSSWAPTPHPPVVAPHKSGTTASHAIRIESYKPPSASSPRPPPVGPSSKHRDAPGSHASGLVGAPSTVASESYVSAAVPLTNVLPLQSGSSSRTSPRQARPSPPLRPRSSQQPVSEDRSRRASSSHRKWIPEVGTRSTAVLDYGDAESGHPISSAKASLVHPSTEPRRSPAAPASPPPVSLPASITLVDSTPSAPLEDTPSGSQQPLSTLSSLIDLELADKNAILVTRRKALESMKLRRAGVKKASEPLPIPLVTPDLDSGVASPIPPLTTAEKTIEQEVADLEKEVLSLESTVIAMDDEEAEEGEIVNPSLPVPSPPILPFPPISSSLPNMGSSRGLKRPNAEDLDSRPTSIPSRSIPPSKRRVFGGSAQRPQRLIINLDESESEGDSGEDTPNTQRLLAEKEEGIRRLKEQIAARLKARDSRRLQVLSNGGNTSSVEGSPAPSDVSQADIVHEAVEAVAGSTPTPVIPRPAGITGTAENPVVIDSDGMDLDGSPSVTANDDVDMDRDVKSGPEVPFSEPLSRHTPTTAIQMIVDSPFIPPAPLSTASFEAYQPLLRRYPQLATKSILSITLPHIPAPLLPTTSLTPFTKIDRGLLSAIVLTNRLKREPDAIMCRSEAGGGKCADVTCKDLHLDKGLQTTDDDLVDYIVQVSSYSEADRSVITAAIQVAKQALSINKTGTAKKKAKAITTTTMMKMSGNGNWNDGTDDSLVMLLDKIGQILQERSA